jgi:hypothetical protein
MIICPKCGSEKVDGGFALHWSGMGLWTEPRYRWAMLAGVAGCLIIFAGLPIIGVPVFLAGWLVVAYLSIRHIKRYGFFRVGVYRPTPCRCGHCGHEWVMMPRD